MKKLILVFLAGLLSIGLFAQPRTWINNVSAVKFRLDGNRGEGVDYLNTAGSPYMFPELRDGKVITKENEELICKIRVDVFVDEMELMAEGKTFFITKPEEFKEYFIDSLCIRYIPILDGKVTRNSFVILNTEGDYSLYTKKRVVFAKAEPPKAYSESKPDRFEVRDDEYYISYKGNTAQKVASMKKMLKIFPELEAIVESYPEKRVDFAKVDELTGMVNYINQKIK